MRTSLPCPLLFLATALPAQRLHFWFPGQGPGDQAGEAVAVAGDVDRDSHPDLIYGCTQHNDGGPAGPGYARVVSGVNGSVLHTLQPAGLQPGDYFGLGVTGAGDIDGDGHDDVAVGAHLHDNGSLIDAGAMWVFSGRTGNVLSVTSGSNALDHFGYALAGGGDANGDRVPDLIVGADLVDCAGPNSDCGEVLVLSGAWIRSQTPPAILHRLGGGIGDNFGSAAAWIGDLDRDGADEFVVGALLEGASNAGGCHVYDGRTGTELASFSGTATNDFLGRAVAGTGDVDGDGFPDLAAGAPGAAGAGFVEVYSGRWALSRSGPRLLHRFDGSLPGDRFGHGVAGAGDMNGDGRPDLVVGAPNVVQAPTTNGYARVFSGRSGARLFTEYGAPGQGDLVGWAVAGGADLDRDGHTEIVFGIPHLGRFPGAAAVYSFGYTQIGIGCQGSNGRTPRLWSEAAPLIGRSWTIRIDDVQPLLTSFLFWGNARLTIPICGLFGMPPACCLYINPMVVAPTAIPHDASGSGSLTFVIPPNPGLLHAEFFHQAAVIDGVSPPSLRLSNGAHATIGSW